MLAGAGQHEQQALEPKRHIAVAQRVAQLFILDMCRAGSFVDILRDKIIVQRAPGTALAAIAAQPLRINLSELNDHPDYKAAAIGALESWAAVTPLRFGELGLGVYPLQLLIPVIGLAAVAYAISNDDS